MKFDNETLLAEEVERLKREVDAVKGRCDDTNQKLRRAKFWGSISIMSLCMGAGSILILISWMFFNSLTAPDTVDYCYIDYGSLGNYRLWGNVEWGADELYGTKEEYDNIVEIAHKTKCYPLRGLRGQEIVRQ